MRDWMKLVPEEELETYRKAGFMQAVEPGKRPALVVVDVTYGFTGSPGLTLAEALDEFPTAAGPVSWEAMPKVKALIEVFRKAELPIVYTRANQYNVGFVGKATKARRRQGATGGRFNDIPEEIAPREQDWVLEKFRASGFFQTPMMAYLTQENVDTLVVCGVSTSGCVRATVVDGFSNGFTTFVVDEACFDRSPFAHAANLFDMQAKYATVLSLTETEKMLETFMPATGRAAAE
ncbi:MAG: hypothetical protein RLZ98_693 [Pseudomonadota bacterium]|jgi:nicotinamidase-related amidase